MGLTSVKFPLPFLFLKNVSNATTFPKDEPPFPAQPKNIYSLPIPPPHPMPVETEIDVISCVELL